MKTYFLVLLLACFVSLGFNFSVLPVYEIKQEIYFPFRGQDVAYEIKYTFIKMDSLNVFGVPTLTGVQNIDTDSEVTNTLKDTLSYFCWKTSKGITYAPAFQERRTIKVLVNPDSVVNQYVGGFPQMEIRDKVYKLESTEDSLGLTKKLVYSIKGSDYFMSPDTIKIKLIKERYEFYHSFSKTIEAEHGMTLTDVRFIFNAKKHENKDYPKLEGYLTLRKVEIKENTFLSAVLKQFEIDKKLLK